MFQVELSRFFQVSGRRFIKLQCIRNFLDEKFRERRIWLYSFSKQPMLAEGSF